MKTILALVSCVLAQGPVGRIVGGYEVAPKFKYPWIASLQYLGAHKCGGTWYTGNTVITAAHCTKNDPAGWAALVHRHNLDLRSEDEHGVAYPVLGFVVHPLFNSEVVAGYDVSIWRVGAPPMRPMLALDDGRYTSTEGTLLTIIGWGKTGSNAKSSRRLLETAVPVYSPAGCKRAYPSLDPFSQQCAGYPEGQRDACQGDSGGPVFVASGGYSTLVGVVSFGNGCAEPGFPGVYTPIAAVADFITAHL